MVILSLVFQKSSYCRSLSYMRPAKYIVYAGQRTAPYFEQNPLIIGNGRSRPMAKRKPWTRSKPKMARLKASAEKVEFVITRQAKNVINFHTVPFARNSAS
jgi:hypothetical protein